MNKADEIRPSLEVSLTALNAALYAGFGYLTYLGLFAPVFGTVRFWPAVVIPAVFSILFSPKVGGVGAAIGIFISDIFVHGNPLLSITVGVPSNFVAFYLIGYFVRKWRRMSSIRLVSLILVQAIPVMGSLALYFGKILDEVTASIFLAISIIIFVFTLMTSLIQRKYSKIVHASSLGLIVGSAMIGAGLWGYSQFFILPVGGVKNAPLIAALTWFLWTYLTEIPFLQFVLPPLVYAVAKAIPVLKIPLEEAGSR